jgi:hypothetical protein
VWKTAVVGGVVVLAIVIVFIATFPDEVVRLSRRLTSAESRWFTLKFEDDVASAAESSVRPPSVSRPEDCPGPVDRERVKRLFALADNNGKGAVMEAFREMELAAIGAALKRGSGVTGPQGLVSGIAAIKNLRNDSRISEKVAKRYEDLRATRKLANDYKYEISAEPSKLYTCMALSLADDLLAR